MKRVLLFALLFTMCFSLFAGTLSGDVIGKFYKWGSSSSWNAGYYTDEFGDNTDEAYLYYIGKGSYTTESAVDSSTFYYIITDDDEGISFYLLSSYGSNLASNSIKGTFTVTYKVDSVTTKAPGSFSTKKVVLTDANASGAFRNALESGKDIEVIITQDSTVLESTKFNLGTIKNASYKTAWDKVNCCTIIYNANGLDVSIATDKIMKGESVELNDCSAVNNNLYEFIEWNTSSDGKGQSYKAGEEITPNKNLTLYAQWTLSKGPTGGYIFYDCDADNDSGNADGLISTECGWRYLEAAPKDLEREYCFGYYRTGMYGENLEVGTDTAIGTGKSNTEALVEAMGEITWSRYENKGKDKYAAKACADYSITVDGVVYDDWFLPSKGELDLMYVNLKKVGLGSFETDYYWSSSEDSGGHAWYQDFYDGYRYHGTRGNDRCVRPVRAFL